MAYSQERRAAVIAKMLPPASVAIPALSRREGISEATLYKGRGDARASGARCGRGSGGCASRGKFAAAVETASPTA